MLALQKNIGFVKDDFTFRAPFAPAEFVTRFKHFYGPTMNAFDAAEQNGKATQLQQELEDLFKAQNKGGKDNTEITATFLRTTVQC